MFATMRREFVATVGSAGSVLTILSKLDVTWPAWMRWIETPLAIWREATTELWGHLLPATQQPASFFAAWLSLFVFLMLIAIGARISQMAREKEEEPNGDMFGLPLFGDNLFTFNISMILASLGAVITLIAFLGRLPKDAIPGANSSPALFELIIGGTILAGLQIGGLEFLKRLGRVFILVLVLFLPTLS